jgi:Nitrile hydratase, alpha chain
MAANLDFDDAWQHLVARTWSDPALKAKLLADPAGVLKANGLTVPAGVTVKVLENTDRVLNLVLPVKAAPAELSEAELHQVAGGGVHSYGRDSDQGANRDPERILASDSDPTDQH